MQDEDLLARLQELEDKGIQLSLQSVELGKRASRARDKSREAQARAWAARDHADRTLSQRAGIWRELKRSHAA